MLSRTAEAVWWMSRYLERAENVARFVDVTQAIALGAGGAADALWAPLVYASGDEGPFQELHQGFSQANVLDFLLFDERNPNSIRACLAAARENARAVRDSLSQPLWEAVNRFYLRVREADAARTLANPWAFLERVKRSSHQCLGVAEATMSHGEARDFMVLGRMIERADKTSRILDVKYFILSAAPDRLGAPADAVQWSALLESTGALHMYRKRHGRLRPAKVAEFLLLDEDFPRSLRFCVAAAARRLDRLARGPEDGQPSCLPARVLLADLEGHLRGADAAAIIAGGLHAFVDGFQRRLNALGDAVAACFFAPPPALAQAQQQ